MASTHSYSKMCKLKQLFSSFLLSLSVNWITRDVSKTVRKHSPLQNCDKSFVGSHLLAHLKISLSQLHDSAMQSWCCIPEYPLAIQQEDLADCDHDELDLLCCGFYVRAAAVKSEKHPETRIYLKMTLE